MTQTAAPPAADRPAHYRLGDETWALILKEYREGATAPFLSRKWRVSEPAIRRRATQHKSTKRDWGDEQAIGQALAREAELEEARRNSPEAVAGRLFDGVVLDEGEAGDPAVLMRAATLASGRAMKGRLWTEAKALAGLAESYARLAQRREDGSGGGSIETMDLPLLFDIAANVDGRVSQRFAVDPDNPEGQPHADLRRRYFERQGRAYRALREREITLINRVKDSEARLAAHGVAPQHWTEREVAAARASAELAEVTDGQIERLEEGRLEDILEGAVRETPSNLTPF